MSEAKVSIDGLAQGALMLAVARYLHDHPDAATSATTWLDRDVESWRQRPTADIADEATKRLEALEGWRSRTEASDRASWESDRTTYAHASLTLQSARSGSFETAAGSLLDFLRDVGAPADELDIH
jgi:hypothetical protein